jgi:hypothetical protein
LECYPFKPKTLIKRQPYELCSSDQKTFTGIPEIMFRASNDNGITFGEINLSNSTTSDSINPQITASGNNVLIAWWENNQTFPEPVIRISTDRGNNFGPILNLSINDTLETWITYYPSNT